MKRQTRREFLFQTTGAVALAALHPATVFAQMPCSVAHPLEPPDPSLVERCPNCGMNRSRWARTWKTAAFGKYDYGVCSFHCLADLATKSAQRPANVKTALYLAPETLQAAETATFVVGSHAAGTMTLKSKLAFASRPEAEAFRDACGGAVADYTETLALAVADLDRENSRIDRRRLKSGKVVLPREMVDECPVCLMFPARYPRHQCQVREADGTVLHFCSTQCLFAFLENPHKYARRDVDPVLIWLSDYAGNRWISAWTAYYVLGSRQWGPMGREAFAFDRIDAARRFQDQHGGDIFRFPDVTLHAIKTK